MLGFRGCRLGISYPELTEIQARAIFEVATAMINQGVKVLPVIMVPLAGTPQELGHQVNVIHKVAESIFSQTGVCLKCKVGTMIEIPRAALVADEIAQHAEFFSFGTNDLTQMTYGFSRDDAAKFLGDYYGKQIFESDPFAKVDQEGVGELMRIAIEKGKKTRPDIKLGICGEHGGEASTVEFCHKLGLKPNAAQKERSGPIRKDAVVFSILNHYKKCNFYYCNGNARNESLCAECKANVDITKLF